MLLFVLGKQNYILVFIIPYISFETEIKIKMKEQISKKENKYKFCWLSLNENFHVQFYFTNTFIKKIEDLMCKKEKKQLISLRPTDF